MPVWPTTLPDYVLENGYQEQFPKNTVETDMESGPIKIRRRFTKVFRKFQVAMVMTASQASTFEIFYYTTCGSGSVSFDWVHPRTRAAMTMRFTQPQPTFQPFGGNYVRVSFSLMEV